MDKLQFQGHWDQIKGKLKEKFGKLTDDDLLKINGKKDQLIGKLEILYGLKKEKIDEQLSEIENAYYSDELRNHWNQLQAKLKQKWNALTEDDIQRIKGRSDHLLEQLQERYKFNREKAEAEFHAFIESLSSAIREKVGAHGKEPRR
jgi:uncharacterized protein YjbJ (UPF0337 family)